MTWHHGIPSRDGAERAVPEVEYLAITLDNILFALHGGKMGNFSALAKLSDAHTLLEEWVEDMKAKL